MERRGTGSLGGWLLALAFLVVAAPGALTQPAETPPEEAPEALETEEQEQATIIAGRIDGEITLAESAYVKRLLEAADQADAGVLAIELNTFGGRVDAAVLIRDALLDAPQTTVVYINKRAISAGALISLACEKIAISSGGTIGAATPVVSSGGQGMPQPVEEKYLSYFREEMRSTAETRGRDGDLAEAMVDADKEVEDVSPAGKLLTLNTATALEYGIADVEAETLRAALDELGFAGPIEEIPRTWSENLVAFLTSPAIASLLFLAMMIFAYLEYQTPGIGVFGATAFGCFLLLYFSHYLVNLAGWEEVLIFGLGLALLLVEVVVLPGFGVAGVLGMLFVLASAVLLLMAGDWSDFRITNPFSLEAVWQVLLTTIAALATIGLLLRYSPISGRGPFGRRLVLAGGLTTAEGYSSHETPEDGLVGREGVASTPLRPAGRALIDGRRYGVETEGGFIEEGARVRVLRQLPGKLVVRQVRD